MRRAKVAGMANRANVTSRDSRTRRWRIRSRIYTWYRHLQETERKLAEGMIENPLEEAKRLDLLTQELASVDVPLSYADELYELKEHIEYVRSRLVSGGGT